MNAVLHGLVAVLPALAIAAAGLASARPALLVGGLAALPIALVAALIAGRARDVRGALVATLAALGVRLVGSLIGAVLLTSARTTDAPAAIAALGLGVVGGLMVDTWVAWRTAGADREPLHV